MSNEAELPTWAQRRLKKLRKDLRDCQEQLRQVSDPKNQTDKRVSVHLGYGEGGSSNQVQLNDDARFSFFPKTNHQIEVQANGPHHICIRAIHGGLRVIPRVSNEIDVQSIPFRENIDERER